MLLLTSPPVPTCNDGGMAVSGGHVPGSDCTQAQEVRDEGGQKPAAEPQLSLAATPETPHLPRLCRRQTARAVSRNRQCQGTDNMTYK